MPHLTEIKSLITSLTDTDISQMELGGIVFDDNRKAIIRSGESKDFQAVPGSGKTTLLVSKLLLIASKWKFTDCGICVLSHTNVAKDEIKKKITASGLGKELLKYPHFIGTIQEFVDKYLAYPALRHLGYKMKFVDTELAREKISVNLASNYHTRLWKRNHPKQAENVSYIPITSITTNGTLTFSIPVKLGATTATYQGFQSAKQNAVNDGMFFYEDMYAFANYALEIYPNYVRNVRGRFPLIFIDEAQDNGQTQDILLEKIFNDPSCIYQRFGDSDQAIYDFHNENGQNTFGNEANRQSSINIGDSKRFPTQHLDLINNFKLSNINTTALPSPPKLVPQIIKYSATAKSQVVTHFLDLIDTYFDKSDNPIVKIVGFVGDSENQENHIGSYIENYKKTRKADRAETLIELVYALQVVPKLEVNIAFYQIIGFIIKKHAIPYESDMLRLQKKSSIRAFLYEKDTAGAFRTALINILNNSITNTEWESFCNCISTVFNIPTLDTSLSQFLPSEDISLTPLPENTAAGNTSTRCDNNNCIYTPAKNIRVEVDTIHGVKGETHDATLVLETIYRTKDISCCLTGNKSTNKDKFKKQLYVATTRAKSLLCIAIDSATTLNSITNTQTVQL